MNRPELVMALLSRTKILRLYIDKDNNFDEIQVSFKPAPERKHEMQYTAKVRIDTGEVVIPLDFDDISGFSELLHIIGAFTYPDKNLVFCIYERHSGFRQATFGLRRHTPTSPRTVSVISDSLKGSLDFLNVPFI